MTIYDTCWFIIWDESSLRCSNAFSLFRVPCNSAHRAVARKFAQAWSCFPFASACFLNALTWWWQCAVVGRQRARGIPNVASDVFCWSCVFNMSRTTRHLRPCDLFNYRTKVRSISTKYDCFVRQKQGSVSWLVDRVFCTFKWDHEEVVVCSVREKGVQFLLCAGFFLVKLWLKVLEPRYVDRTVFGRSAWAKLPLSCSYNHVFLWQIQRSAHMTNLTSNPWSCQPAVFWNALLCSREFTGDRLLADLLRFTYVYFRGDGVR